MDRCQNCGTALTLETPESSENGAVEVRCLDCGDSWIEDSWSNKSTIEIEQLKNQLLLEREDSAIFRKAIWMTAGDRNTEFTDDPTVILMQVSRNVTEQSEISHRYEVALIHIRDLWQENQTGLGDFLQRIISKAFNPKK